MGDASLWAMLARLVLSLGVVIGLMLGAAVVVRRRGSILRKIGHDQPLEVLARQTLGQKASVQVVRMGERAVLLGVTEHSVTYLTEGDPADFELADMVVDSTVVDLTDHTMSSGGGPSADGTARSGGAMRLGSSWTGVLDTLRDKSTRR
jgi:flagellar protein FliO/FliZ